MMIRARLLSRVSLAGIFLTSTLAAAVAAEPATLLGVTKDWSAFTTGSGGSKICYALAKPVSSDPKSAKRDPIYFIITDWPGRKPRTKSEPEAVPGYQYKDGATVSVQVGGAKFEMFAKNDAGAGAAWVRERADEVHLIEAMKKSKQLVVTGTSQRGTVTHDTYSLAGLTDALQKIHEACGM
jgi:invasion associated locus B (IalB) protein